MLEYKPLLLGLAATTLAAGQLFAWLALGACFLKKYREAETALPSALLIGSSITAFVYAVLLAAGSLRIALGAVVFILALGMLLGAKRALPMVAEVFLPFRAAPKWIKTLSIVTLVFYWVLAICPPRDADVMRYHLAHIRQIDAENGWHLIPDYCYALPFGWTLNYLPFEHLGIPQGAHLLNLGVCILAIALIFHVLKQYSSTPVPLLLTGLLLLQPHMVKFGTTAFADMYVIFVVLAVAILILRPGTAGLLGFAAWVGAQSRYQTIVIGIAVTIIVIWRRRSELRSYAAGAACAIALSSPFYIANLALFHNPFWPVMIFKPHTYADQVAAAFTAGMRGSYSDIGASAWALLTDPLVFPFPLMALTLLLVSLRWRKSPTVPVVVLLALVVSLWALVQPGLYPRFSFMMVPLVILGWAPILDRYRRAVVIGFMILFFVFAGVDAVYSHNSLQYIATGNAREFHHATWFYEVYEWANRSTPKDARFLVIVNGGESYYLARPYRRADPCLSAVVDWPSLSGPRDLGRLLDAGRYQYIIYHDTDWSYCPGGRHMAALLRQAIDAGVLTPVAEFPIRLVTFRSRGQSEPALVRVLRRSRT
jgi:hypothetical protein